MDCGFILYRNNYSIAAQTVYFQHNELHKTVDMKLIPGLLLKIGHVRGGSPEDRIN